MPPRLQTLALDNFEYFECKTMWDLPTFDLPTADSGTFSRLLDSNRTKLDKIYTITANRAVAPWRTGITMDQHELMNLEPEEKPIDFGFATTASTTGSKHRRHTSMARGGLIGSDISYIPQFIYCTLGERSCKKLCAFLKCGPVEKIQRFFDLKCSRLGLWT